MSNRPKLWCKPLDSSIFGSLMLPGVPRSVTPLALLHLDSYSVPDAILVAVKATGVLAAWKGGAMQIVDQRRARAALDRMALEAPNSDEVKADLAAALKDWRAKADMTQARAAEVLGMSKRSYEGIEAGRGFVYPQLLLLALRAFD